MSALKTTSMELGKPALTLDQAIIAVRETSERLATKEQEILQELLQYLSIMGMVSGFNLKKSHVSQGSDGDFADMH